jgi:hypothetical protein
MGSIFFRPGPSSAVIDNYNQHFDLKLTPGEKSDLAEYLKSL